MKIGIENDDCYFDSAPNTVSITPSWELGGGLRWDCVEAPARESGRPDDDNRRLKRTDTNLSCALGLLHKMTPDISVYASLGRQIMLTLRHDF